MDSVLVYTSLEKLPHGTIRLLELLPGQPEEQIECNLRIATVRDDFKALSYVWGSDPPIHEIKINDLPFYVRQNLIDGLVYVRDQTVSQMFWVDAICVNQEDLSERSSQVHLMAQLFGNATMVVAWLGVNPEYANQPLPPVPLPFGKNRQSALMSHDWSGLPRSDDSTESLVKFDKFPEDTLRTLFDLFSRSYWRRMWIVQEIILAKRLEVQHGRFRTSWNHLIEWWTYVHKYNQSEDVHDVFKSLLSNCRIAMLSVRLENLARDRVSYLQRAARFKIHYDTFYTLSHQYSMKQSTDPRDKIIPMLELTWYLGSDVDTPRDNTNYYEMSELQLYEHVSDLFRDEQLTEAQDFLRMISELTEIEERMQEDIAKIRECYIELHKQKLAEENNALLVSEKAQLEIEIAQQRATYALLQAEIRWREEAEREKIAALKIEKAQLEAQLAQANFEKTALMAKIAQDNAEIVT